MTHELKRKDLILLCKVMANEVARKDKEIEELKGKVDNTFLIPQFTADCIRAEGVDDFVKVYITEIKRKLNIELVKASSPMETEIANASSRFNQLVKDVLEISKAHTNHLRGETNGNV